MVCVFKHQTTSTRKLDLEEFRTEYDAGQSITVTSLRVADYISKDVEVMVDHITDPNHILSDKTPVKKTPDLILSVRMGTMWLVD